MTFIWVVIAGGCGAIARFLLDRGVERLVRKSTVAGVVLVNLLGSFVLGAIIGASVHVSGSSPLPVLSPTTYAALTTGLCGGFTTFSTAMADSLRLWRSERVGLALVHLLGTFAGAVVCCQLGIVLFG